ncbi:phosphoethanolamine N-methyltransferase [Shimia gijangensis]|uniref:Phosphoethanolamine N-methyltransferase n=1 Tax=Shimia gijangensis TaxID=1470563 RepID=A0A1M6M9E0_9RHOB|nr:class I SAM-dependent methyltransferase [Shimia gijangensis]SHJ80088.1 phosphoethanolamine N-methyltransferase [Shimia gijangensis]
MSHPETEYSDEFAGGLELLWGQGFLSPGGKEEVLSIVEGIDLTGKNILDIGSGLGGPAICLANAFQVGHITGVDIEPLNVQRATAYACDAAVAEKVTFQAVDGGDLPFENEAFDIVFSKDAVTEAPNKTDIFEECFRVLRPDGWLVMSDWFRSSDPYTPEMNDWLETLGVTLEMATIHETTELLSGIGFSQAKIADKTEWYQKHAVRELESMAGKGKDRFEALLGAEGAAEWLTAQNLQVVVATQGQLRPGHIRAEKR